MVPTYFAYPDLATPPWRLQAMEVWIQLLLVMGNSEIISETTVDFPILCLKNLLGHLQLVLYFPFPRCPTAEPQLRRRWTHNPNAAVHARNLSSVKFLTKNNFSLLTKRNRHRFMQTGCKNSPYMQQVYSMLCLGSKATARKQNCLSPRWASNTMHECSLHREGDGKYFPSMKTRVLWLLLVLLNDYKRMGLPC